MSLARGRLGGNGDLDGGGGNNVSYVVSLVVDADRGRGKGRDLRDLPSRGLEELVAVGDRDEPAAGDEACQRDCILRETAKQSEDSRDGEDSELALVWNVEDG